MPTTSPDNIYYADTGTTSNDVTVSATEASSVQMALNSRQLRGFRPADNAALLAITGMALGDTALRQDNGWTYLYNGTAWAPKDTPGWVSWTPSLSAGVGSWSVGNGTLLSRYRYVNLDVEAQLRLTFGTTTVMGTQPIFTLPVAMEVGSPPYSIFGEGTYAQTTGSAIAQAAVYRLPSNTGVGVLAYWGTAGAYSNMIPASGSAPLPFGSGYYLDVTVRYKV